MVGQNRKPMNIFPRTFSLSNFSGIAIADVVCPAGKYTQVGVFTVPAQQAIAWGNNVAYSGGVQGNPVFIDFRDSSDAKINGTIRLQISDANETNVQAVMEERTERLAADANDRTKAVLLPMDMRFARQDSKLIIAFLPDGSSSKTIQYNATNTKGILPITVQQ